MEPEPQIDAVRTRAGEILDAAWDEFRGHSYPNRGVYGHQWLWDSCFHAIAWAALDDRRAERELASVFFAQLPNGFVPHMRYAGPSQYRGPLSSASSYTQPPVHAAAALALAAAGMTLPPPLLAHIEHAFEYLWTSRMSDAGLIKIVHPWEAGADDSPRWDGWIGHSDWNRPEWTGFDLQLVQSTVFGPEGDAVANPAFEAAPAAFNAIAAHGMTIVHELTGHDRWLDRAGRLADAIDAVLWDPVEALWSDLAVAGPDTTVAIPTLDGVLPALSTRDPAKAAAALDQLADPDRFGAPYGLAYVARQHPVYRGDLYWRGAAWPQLNHLARLAARRWDRPDLAEDIAAMSRRGATASGFSELWDPGTGEARGATPQTWAALAAVVEPAQPTTVR